jgi:hypothetical protein
MASTEMLRRVALVKSDVSEELSASIIKVTKIGELGTKRQFLQGLHGVTSHKTLFFIVTAVKTSNLEKFVTRLRPGGGLRKMELVRRLRMPLL